MGCYQGTWVLVLSRWNMFLAGQKELLNKNGQEPTAAQSSRVRLFVYFSYHGWDIANKIYQRKNVTRFQPVSTIFRHCKAQCRNRRSNYPPLPPEKKNDDVKSCTLRLKCSCMFVPVSRVCGGVYVYICSRGRKKNISRHESHVKCLTVFV